MQIRTLAVIGLALAAGPLAAQPKPPPAPTPAAAPKLTIDSTFGDLLSDPRTKAVIDRHMPGFSERLMNDPEVATMFAGVTLAGMAVDPDHGRMFTPQVLEMFTRELAAAQQEPPQPPS